MLDIQKLLSCFDIDIDIDIDIDNEDGLGQR